MSEKKALRGPIRPLSGDVAGAELGKFPFDAFEWEERPDSNLNILSLISGWDMSFASLTALTTALATVTTNLATLTTNLDTVTTDLDTVTTALNDFMEVGNNSNGHYVQFSNGLQICWASAGNITTSTLSNENIGTYGWSYYRGTKTVTYPKEFVAAPKVFAAGDTSTTSGFLSVRVDSVNTTTCRLVPIVTGNVTLSAAYMAIGYWK